MNTTMNYIGVHHFAGNLTLGQLNALHKSEWPELPSKLRPDLWVGYNFVIWKDGTFTQTRYIGEETAAIIAHNFDTISICLAGNFTVGVDMPTDAQIKTLKWFLNVILAGDPASAGLAVLSGTVINVQHGKNIFPHRVLATPGHTECYGNALSDSWARDLIAQPTPVAVVPHIASPQAPQPVPAGQNTNLIIALMQEVVLLCQKLLALKKAQVMGNNSCLKNARG